MNLSPFAACCGLSIYYDFISEDCDEDGTASGDKTTEQVLAKLDAFISGEGKDRRGGPYTRKGGSLAVLNSYQKDFWEPHLLRRGFKIIADNIFNPNSEAELSIYLIDHEWRSEYID